MSGRRFWEDNAAYVENMTEEEAYSNHMSSHQTEPDNQLPMQPSEDQTMQLNFRGTPSPTPVDEPQQP